MELAEKAKELWRHKRWLPLGAVVALFAALATTYQLGVLPPSLSSRTLQFSSASTTILVDSDTSAIADVDRDVTPLTARAGVYSRLLTSQVALDLIGREAGVNPNMIAAQGPFDINQPRTDQEPTAERRSAQLLNETDQYRLRFVSGPTLPLVSIFAQAPTTSKAIRLADGAAKALSIYVADLQRAQDVPERRRVAIRQLGPATGGVVDENANGKIAFLVFIAVFAATCVLILIAARFIEAWRASGEDDVAARNGHNDPETVAEERAPLERIWPSLDRTR